MVLYNSWIAVSFCLRQAFWTTYVGNFPGPIKKVRMLCSQAQFCCHISPSLMLQFFFFLSMKTVMFPFLSLPCPSILTVTFVFLVMFLTPPCFWFFLRYLCPRTLHQVRLVHLPPCSAAQTLTLRFSCSAFSRSLNRKWYLQFFHCLFWDCLLLSRICRDHWPGQWNLL